MKDIDDKKFYTIVGVLSLILVGLVTYVVQEPATANEQELSSANTEPKWTVEKVCMAALAHLMHVPVDQLTVDRRGGALRYMTPTDRAKAGAGMNCHLMPVNKVMWRNADGRWRNHPLDEEINFSIVAGRLHIYIWAGTERISSESFSLADL